MNIHGHAVGAFGLPEGVKPGPDTVIFTKVDTKTKYGWDPKVKIKVPMLTGELGSTDITRKNWEHFAVGALMRIIQSVVYGSVETVGQPFKFPPKPSIFS